MHEAHGNPVDEKCFEYTSDASIYFQWANAQLIDPYWKK
jgi:hypothetical protein